MDLLIAEGDYLPDGMGGFCSASGSAGVLQRALYRLSVPRGSFLPLPNLGSNLYRLYQEKSSAWEALAIQYVREALEVEPDLWVTQVEVHWDHQEKIEVKVYLSWHGEVLSLSTQVNG